ncbi:MAG: hypothetical protein Kow0029_28720 [Candidatus Rifleibacteriota bacterium]
MAINLGFLFLSNIDRSWKIIEQNELAYQEMEALTSASDFSYQFSKISGQFRKAFQAGVEANLESDKLAGFLRKRAQKIFKKPFPEKRLFTFQILEKNKQPEILFYESKEIISKRALSRIFGYLVNLNRGDEIPDFEKKQNEKLLTRILGPESSGELMANSQRAKTSYALYRSFPNWFIWDYFSVPGKGTFGYIVLSKCEDKNRFDGMLLALRDFRDRRLGFAAFVPLFRGYGGNVIQAPLHKSFLFRNWIRSKVTLVENDLEKWLAKGVPPTEELGNFRIFSYLGKGNTHLTTLLLPRVKESELPFWLKLLNYIMIVGLAFFLFRGLIFDIWPDLKLRYRFLTTFLLATTLPLSLLMIVSSGYINQYRRSIHYQTVSNLVLCIKQFDSRKAQIADDYKSAFIKLLKNPDLAGFLREDGPHSRRVAKLIEDSFDNAAKPLPLMCYAIFDETAQGIRGYGNNEKKEIDPFIDSFSYPIVAYMRKQMSLLHPDYVQKDYVPPDTQTLAAQAYNAIASRDLVDEIGKRRSFPLVRQRGDGNSTQMHDYITVDGIEKYAVLLAWEDNGMDRQTIKQTSDYLALNNPEFSFVHYKVKPQGLELFVEPDRHIPVTALPLARKLAESVHFRGSYSSMRTESFSLVAYPSKKYSNNIIVGIANNYSLEESVFYRNLVLWLVVLLSIIIVLLCAYYTSRIVVAPISLLKESLDRVAGGELNTDIKISGEDELGTLSTEFSIMVQGLRERNRLASLLSDHAIEALSKSQSVDGILAGDAFNGVALVSDIRNFTGLCETYPPDQITELLNKHFARMSAVISEQGGRIYKFIGDAIEAVFPDDDSCDEAAEIRAVKAAFIMNLELKRINAERKKDGLFSYKTGVGVARGRFFSGGVGSIETRLDYAVLGEPLKTAAKLEAKSVHSPDLPIIVDESVKKVIETVGFNCAPLSTDSSAYRIDEIVYQLDLRVENDQSESHADHVKETFGGSENILKPELSRWLLFAIGTVISLVFFSGIYLGIEFRDKALLKTRLIEASDENLRLIEQLKSEDSLNMGYEDQCWKAVKSIEKDLVDAKPTRIKEILKQNLAAKIEAFEKSGMKFNRVFAAAFGDASQDMLNPEFAEPIMVRNWSKEQVKTLQKFAIYKHHVEFYLNQSRGTLRKELDFEIKDLLGETNPMTFFYSEAFNTAVEGNIDGKEELIFTSFLVSRNSESEKIDISRNASVLRDARYVKLHKVVGMIMLTMESNDLVPGRLLVDSYETPNQKLALIGEDGKIYHSVGFPLEKLDESGHGKFEVLTRSTLNFVGQRYKVAVLNKIDGGLTDEGLRNKIFFPIALLIFIFMILTINGKTFINKSLSAKLWAGFLICSLLPVATVYLVIDLFSVENLNARIFQEKADLQRFLELFELRQSFSEPLAWKNIKEWAFSDDLRTAIESVDAQKTETPDFKMMNRAFAKWYRRMGKLRETVSNFVPRDAAVVSKVGWEYIYNGQLLEHYDKGRYIDPVEYRPPDKQFGLLLTKIAKNLITRMRIRDADKGFDGDSLKGEIALKTGLKTVRAMFGDDVAVKMANGVGLPVKMSMLDSMVGIIIYPVKQIYMPDFVIVNVALFVNGGYLNKIASMYKGDYAIFPFEKVYRGRTALPDIDVFGLDMRRVFSWVGSSNMPYSGYSTANNQEFYFEARRGLHQTSMIIAGYKPLAPVYEEVKMTRWKFVQGIVLSLFLIILLAKNVSGEIVAPIAKLNKGMREIALENFSYRIAVNRTDELGDLCNSFDKLARGLEEKFLIGRMLSQSAMDSTLKDSKSKKEDVVVVYVGSPGFSSWLNLSGPQELFADLQKQIAEISRIIIDEGGEIDKIIGDKVLAVFRNSSQSAEVAAAKAALKIMNAEQRGILPFPVAAGINRGEVIAGVLGVGNKKDFTVIGDAVNVAARIESLAETMRYHRVLVSEGIFDNLNCEITAREYGTVELKGKSSALRVFQLELQ